MFVSKKFFLFAFSIIISAFAFEMVALADNMDMDSILCGGYSIFRGPLGKALAVFSIVALGVGLFMGKITWGLVFAVALGIGAVFGAPKIVSVITGGNEICQNSQTS
jgi:type IV secretory pathway VirB2 component (pilin)